MEIFIEKVRFYTCLWNMGDMSYRDIGKKELAWERIARECGMVNGQEAKSQWKKLRDSHREALRRRKTSTGQPVQNLKPWKYETLMEFIVPQSQIRETFSLSNPLQDLESHQDTHNILDSNVNNVAESPPPPPESPLPSSSSIETQKRKQDNFTEGFRGQDRKRRRQQRYVERDDTRRSFMDINYASQDALSHLFASFCQKTRELPKYLQLRVQREIFNSVTRAEEEAMSLNSYYDDSTPTSPYAYTSATHYQTSPLEIFPDDSKPDLNEDVLG